VAGGTDGAPVCDAQAIKSTGFHRKALKQYTSTALTQKCKLNSPVTRAPTNLAIRLDHRGGVDRQEVGPLGGRAVAGAAHGHHGVPGRAGHPQFRNRDAEVAAAAGQRYREHQQ
jgi:hypothetical protein